MNSGGAAVRFERLGAGEPLLLLHGTGGSRAHWRPVVDLLKGQRELLLVDLPGHGESDPPPAGIPHTPAGYATVLEQLLDEPGLDRPHLAGNSVGGWTALELAKRGRARSVVAIGPAGLWRNSDPWRCVFQLWAQHKLGRAFAPLTPGLMRNPASRAVLLRGTVAKPGRVPPEAAVEMAVSFAQTPCFDRHLSETRRDRFQGGREIEVPVTVAWGEKDRLVPGRARRRDELPAHARVLTLPGCGHLPMWDDPELVAATILEAAEESASTTG
jgi:pimeloyl-ACP methyl ester carboxylesterase